MEIVSCLLEQIKATEEACEQLDKSDISIPIRKMELARIRFMIASYMRLRLQKIQKNVHFLSKQSVEELDMEKDSQHILRYKSVSHLLKNGAVKMI